MTPQPHALTLCSDARVEEAAAAGLGRILRPQIEGSPRVVRGAVLSMRSPWSLEGVPECQVSTGRDTMKVLPWPSLDSARIEPPCASTSMRAM